MNQKNHNTKENFCAPCMLAIPAALGVGGIAASSANNTEEKEKQARINKIILWSSIGITLMSIIIFIYLKNRCKTCK